MSNFRFNQLDGHPSNTGVFEEVDGHRGRRGRTIWALPGRFTPPAAIRSRLP